MLKPVKKLALWLKRSRSDLKKDAPEIYYMSPLLINFFLLIISAFIFGATDLTKAIFYMWMFSGVLVIPSLMIDEHLLPSRYLTTLMGPLYWLTAAITLYFGPLAGLKASGVWVLLFVLWGIHRLAIKHLDELIRRKSEGFWIKPAYRYERLIRRYSRKTRWVSTFIVAVIYTITVGLFTWMEWDTWRLVPVGILALSIPWRVRGSTIWDPESKEIIRVPKKKVFVIQSLNTLKIHLFFWIFGGWTNPDLRKEVL